MGRRLLTALGIFLAFAVCSPAVYANIDNLSNMSAEWIRTGNRNAATDAADIVFYNPAGLTELSEGVHLNISNQTMFRKPQHTFEIAGETKSYEQDSPDYFLPNFFGAYNKDSWSVFGGIYIPGGGAVVDYPNGSITTQTAGYQTFGTSVTGTPFEPLSAYGFTTIGYNGDLSTAIYTNLSNEFLKASSVYLTTTIGGAYKINDSLSFAAGIRYISAENTVKAAFTMDGLTPNATAINSISPGTIPTSTEMRVDHEMTADGFGGLIAVNFNATEKLNLALNYHTGVELDFETKVNRDDLGLAQDGEKNRRDFPGHLAFGAGYDITEQFYTELNYTYWFQKEADWGNDGTRDISDMAGDAWSTGVALSYDITPEFEISAGTTYTKFDWDDINGYYSANLGSCEVLYSDNWHVGTGFAWAFTEGMKFNFSLAQTLWDDETINYNGITVATENATTVIAVGLDMAF